MELNVNDIREIIKPINSLEEKIINDKEFIEGVNYGKPRPGHPEGKVLYHIREVLDNVDEYSTNRREREDLRVIAIIHDSFKYKVNYKLPKTGENHHAYIARKFAEKYNLPNYILDIIELHDEAYNSYNIGFRKGKWAKANERAIKLLRRLGKSVKLYTVFYKCDTNTGNKANDSYIWFKELIKKSDGA